MDHARGQVKTWHVVETHPRQEQRVARGLLDQGIETLLPLYWRERKKRYGGVELVEVPLFGRYLMFALEDVYRQYGSVANTRGVLRVLCATPGIPSVLKPEVVACVRAEMGEGGGAVHLEAAVARPYTWFEKGEAVRVADGPLIGMNGLYERGDRERCVVLMSYLGGRERPVELPRNVLEKL